MLGVIARFGMRQLTDSQWVNYLIGDEGTISGEPTRFRRGKNSQSVPQIGVTTISGIRAVTRLRMEKPTSFNLREVASFGAGQHSYSQWGQEPDS